MDPNAYGGWDGRCPGCDRDVARFSTVLHDAGFDGITVLANAAATLKNVKNSYLQAMKELRRDDLLVLYFSGHGGQQPDESGDEMDGRDETLCLWDGELVDDKVEEFFVKAKKGVRIFYATDSCNSGTNFRGVPVWGRGSPVALSARVVKKFKGSMLHFGGCSDGRFSYGDDQGGVFTNALLDSLGKARSTISYAEWFRRASDRMPEDQRPVIDVWGETDFAGEDVFE